MQWWHTTQWGFEMYPIAIHHWCWSNYDFTIHFIMYIHSINQYKMLLNKFIYCIFLGICNTMYFEIKGNVNFSAIVKSFANWFKKLGYRSQKSKKKLDIHVFTVTFWVSASFISSYTSQVGMILPNFASVILTIDLC